MSFLELTEPVGDPMSVITMAIESQTVNVLVEAGNLPQSFFDLKSGVAGEFVQKMVNYQLRVAAVFDSAATYPERFNQFLVEARRHPNFRAFNDRAEAEAWLVAS